MNDLEKIADLQARLEAMSLRLKDQENKSSNLARQVHNLRRDMRKIKGEPEPKVITDVQEYHLERIKKRFNK